MSFSSDVKKELSECQSSDIEILKAELYGILLFGKTFREDKIVFTTENSYAAKRATYLLERLYTPIIERQNALRARSGDSRLYKISVVDSNDCRRIYEDFGHSSSQVTLRVNRANLPTDSTSAAFVRGAFFACGSVSDPMKSYHAEFCVPHKNLSVDLFKILTEVTECRFNPKTVRRSGSYIVYFKESDQICDLLTYIGAPIQSMEIMGGQAGAQQH